MSKDISADSCSRHSSMQGCSRVATSCQRFALVIALRCSRNERKRKRKGLTIEVDVTMRHPTRFDYKFRSYYSRPNRFPSIYDRATVSLRVNTKIISIASVISSGCGKICISYPTLCNWSQSRAYRYLIDGYFWKSFILRKGEKNIRKHNTHIICARNIIYFKNINIMQSV